jgi:hypothetical protein
MILEFFDLLKNSSDSNSSKSKLNRTISPSFLQEIQLTFDHNPKALIYYVGLLDDIESLVDHKSALIRAFQADY